MMKTLNNKEEIFLKDYKATDFIIKTINLDFHIKDKLQVTSTMQIEKRAEDSANIQLNGEELTTLSLKINNKELQKSDYSIENDILTIFNVPNKFTLETKIETNPFKNTQLMGIYKTASCLASQCEPEGFRRITWFIDRPDILPIWNVSITAKASEYEVLLSNGNLIADTTFDGYRTCKFHDPFPKPSYLFALVAGNLDVCQGSIVTKSGRKVALNVFVEKGKKERAKFALTSLISAMKWDEQRFNLEYELEVFSIVAVSDFNFGAMENTSLNIFNDAYILANPILATDDDYFNIEAVVAHEYFHNFTGNKITCKNWFQLTLKEGLTVYRDSIFSEDLNHKDIVRINHVDKLRNYQFQEDKGPLSHPLRPLSYIEMNNFYTTTVYEKGAEVIRMIATMIGQEKFKTGMAIYFKNFSGQAVTCEDFIWSMEQTGIDLTKFKNWYLQSGTPEVVLSTTYNPDNQEFNLSLQQNNYPTADQKQKGNLTLPLKIALLDNEGKILESSLNGKVSHEHLIILEDKTMSVSLQNVVSEPTLSFNRNFSAPIIVKYPQTDAELINLMKYDNDGFIAYESSRKYLKKHLLEIIDKIKNNQATSTAEMKKIVAPYGDILNNYQSNPRLVSMLLKLPTIVSFEEDFSQDFPLKKIDSALKLLTKHMALEFESKFIEIFNALKDKENEYSDSNVGLRALKNTALTFLIKTDKAEYLSLCLKYYKNTKSMTKKIAALLACKDYVNTTEQQEIFASFYQDFKAYPLVLNKWFGIQASIAHKDVMLHIKKLTQLDTFSYTNPNKVRYLFSGFASNYLYFHNSDGSGYQLLADVILKIDAINPSISAPLAKIFAKIKVHTKKRQDKVKIIINNLLSKEDISKGLYEILTKIKADIG